MRRAHGRGQRLGARGLRGGNKARRDVLQIAHRKLFYYPLTTVTLGNLQKTVRDTGKRQRMVLPDTRDD